MWLDETGGVQPASNRRPDATSCDTFLLAWESHRCLIGAAYGYAGGIAEGRCVLE